MQDATTSGSYIVEGGGGGLGIMKDYIRAMIRGSSVLRGWNIDGRSSASRGRAWNVRE